METKLIQITSVEDLLTKILSSHEARRGGEIYFRGISNRKFLNKAKVYREFKHKRHEGDLLSSLLMEAPEVFSSDKTVFEKLVRAQHHGLPTRLLDVSQNPLVALYFACSGESDMDKDGAFYLFDIAAKRLKNFDSDIVSLIANMGMLREEERKEISDCIAKAKKGEGSRNIDQEWFNDIKSVKRLVQFVRVEKPYFLNEIKAIDLAQFFLMRPKKSNKRIVAQSGAFIASGVYGSLGQNSSKAFNISKFVIPFEHKQSILDQLDVLNINGRALFPEIDRQAEYISNAYLT